MRIYLHFHLFTWTGAVDDPDPLVGSAGASPPAPHTRPNTLRADANAGSQSPPRRRSSRAKRAPVRTDDLTDGGEDLSDTEEVFLSDSDEDPEFHVVSFDKSVYKN